MQLSFPTPHEKCHCLGNMPQFELWHITQTVAFFAKTLSEEGGHQGKWVGGPTFMLGAGGISSSGTS